MKTSKNVLKAMVAAAIIASGFIGLLVCPLSNVNAQGVGVNSYGNAADPSAMFDVSSTSKGTLIPRMATAQRDAIISPANSLQIFNTDVNCLQIYINTRWQNIFCDLGCSTAPATPGTISGNTAPCQNAAGVTYSIAQVAGATSYNWSVPAGASIIAGQGTIGIVVNFGTSSGSVSVTASNSCGISTAQSLSVTVQLVPAQTSAIAGTSPVCQGQNGYSYSVANVAGVTYTWSYSGTGFACTSGCNTNAITTNFSVSATSGTLTVIPSNVCGSGTSQTYPITVITVPPAPSAGTNSPSTVQIVWNWNSVSGAIGYKYNTANDYSSAINNGTNTNYTQSGLTCNFAYTLYVWAYNICGNSPVTTLTQITSSCCINTWTQLNPPNPPIARYDHTEVWDAANNRLLVFGGLDGNTIRNDLWAYSPFSNTWTQLNPTGGPPVARYEHTAVWDAANNRMLVFGGLDGNIIRNDLWAYSASGNSWAQLSPSGGLPVARYKHTAVWDATNNRMLIFGGLDGNIIRNDLWAYISSSDSWMQLNPSGGPPVARYTHSAVWDIVNSRMLVFGGLDGNIIRNDLWAYSSSSDSWTQLNPTGGPPVARYQFTATWDASHSQMLVFGGLDGNTIRNDLWSFSSAGNSWTQLSPVGGPPVARYKFTAAWDIANSVMWVFGGLDGNIIRNDLWQYCP